MYPIKYNPKTPTRKFSFNSIINLIVPLKSKSIIAENIKNAINKFKLIVKKIYLVDFIKTHF
jgi:hypothetical protein